MIRLILVDDHHVVRRGLRSYFESFPDLKIVAEAASAEELLQNLPGIEADVIVLDILLPGGMDGLEAARMLQSQPNPTRIVILTAYSDPARAMAALRSGVLGYVRKDSAPEVLLAAVRAAANGQIYLDQKTADSLAENIPHAALSLREQQVLEQLARGSTNREIAATLVISEETVKSHVSNILAKLGLENRTQVISHALKHGMLRRDE
ncbi:MAG: response regulator transcription factor [Anaerolineaceae bacterium]|jgi:DNA-binding NarL/FixJ family response regulator|nr:response regulator transcription factor [Anaerolineaceae bacterium]